MMLLSTMLIGTVSTVNATVSGLSEIYFTPSIKWQEGGANFRLNVQDSSNNWHKITMTKVDETNLYTRVSLILILLIMLFNF